ncbi:cellulose binding domain-containing protein [Echinicola jeungdonensis]|uniref:LamG-like jellyroll fold domain-containing protein n=1 Tax=Echinicola jeungdonensis TaxID=709343 RepID=A0ABV5J9F2_9BACT|nr:LamG-like jellyroll fold domain-containing protein [Echinicola jeungdonensis]MDN3670442.1 cellulose binding domain-containing protein [Echinicola jeungdonensis]
MKKQLLAIFLIFACTGIALSQEFVHPGGLHTLEDLNRMKEKVAAGESPWIEGWNALISDWKSSATYGMTDGVRENANLRQNMNRDAQAAYLNALRWYISGDVAHAEKAISIYKAYANTVNQIPSGGNTDILGLGGIGFTAMAMGAEIMRLYEGWAPEDFEKFKFMMKEYFYPVSHDFLTNHRGACPTHYWANWDLNNISALIAIGILVDDRDIFNEGVEYFKSGVGSGNIHNAIPFVQGDFGQWQESGRDQSHALLGIGLMANSCQMAWNQGVNLYGYDDNLFLKGAEYVARTGALSLEAPFFEELNTCSNRGHRWVASNQLGRYFDQPVWEIVYNHYVVKQGLEAPHVEAMAQIMRFAGSTNDQLGHGTLIFTLDAAASPVALTAPPGQPQGLTVLEGIGRVELIWNAVETMDAEGFTVKRSTSPGGPYTTIASWTGRTNPRYTDTDVENGTTYYYVVSARNEAGEGPESVEISATPMDAVQELPIGWTRTDIGNVSTAGEASYALVNTGHSFITKGAGSIGGTSDALGFTYGIASGDVTLTARVAGFGGVQKTGIMIRESLDPDAKTVLMKIGDGGWRIAGMGSRTETGANMEWLDGNRYTWRPNIWFRITRTGNTFTVYESNNKDVWFEVGSRTIEMAEDVYVGLFNSSGNTTSLNETRFDHVSVTGHIGNAPEAPANFTASPGNTQNMLDWDEVSGASSYTLKRSTTSGGPYEVVATNLNVTEYTDNGLENGTTYYYVVSAANLSGESFNALEVSAAPELAIAPAPEEVTAVSVSGQQINLSWNESLSATSYNVKRATVSGGPYTTIASPDTTSYSDTTVTPDIIYYYAITAVNALGESDSSLEVSATPGQVGYWKFDETEGSDAADSWGDNMGALSSGTIFSEGLIDNAVRLNGSDGYVTLPEGIVSSLTDFSISTWIKLDEVDTWARVFDFGSGRDNFMFVTPRNGASGTLRYGINNGTGQQRINTGSTLTSGRWYHLAVTQSGTTAILYLDGVEVGRNDNMTLNPSSLGNTPQNWIGKSQYPDPLLEGLVDDFKIYSRALDSSEVDSLFNAVDFPAVAPVSLLAAPGDNKITLKWNDSQGATSYTVYRSDISGGPYAQVGTSLVNEYLDTEVLNDSTYYYVVTATTPLEESAYSEEISGTPNGGRVAYLKFDETTGTNAADSWDDNMGTLSSGATFTGGLIDNAVSLNGIDGYVTLPEGIVSSLTDFSITTWVKLDKVNNWARLFDFGSGTSNYMFITPKNGSNGRLRYAIKNGGGEQQINTSATLTTGRWYHVAVTQSGTTAILYLDGVEVGRNTSMTLSPSSLGNTPQNWIGKSQWPDPLLAGQVDDFKIYSEALDASEVAEMAFAYLPPAAPKNLSTVAENNQVSLSWTPALGGTGYNIKKATDLEGPFEVIANVVDTSYIDKDAVNCERYFYTVSTINNVGESEDSSPASPWLGSKLSGTLIGTDRSGGDNPATTKEAAVDGDIRTYFDAPTNTAWVGYDLGEDGKAVITKVRYAPRPGHSHRMNGSQIQGANSPDFSDAETLFYISRPDEWVMTEQTISNSGGYRYIRYLSPNGYGSIAELEFYGLPARLPELSSDRIVEGTYDSAFHYSTVASDLPEEFVATGLPKGLSIDTCTGVISGAPKAAGTFPVAITATNYYGSATDTVTMVIKKNQFISFSSIPAKHIGDADLALNAVASSGLPVIYSSSDTTVATIVDGNKLHFNAVGTCVITALQDGDSLYYPAEEVSQSFEVLSLDLKVLHKDGDNGNTSYNLIKPHLQIANQSEVDVAYNELTLRYWITPENYAGIDTWIDFAELGKDLVSMNYVVLENPHNGAFGYVEYSFEALEDTLFAGGNSGEIQSRLNNQDWAGLDETNDYSYQSGPSYSANENITLYRNGLLVWGTEPEPVVPITGLKVYARNKESKNQIGLTMEIANEGNIPINYEELKVRYWFTKEGSGEMMDVVDYAKLGSENLSGQFVVMDPTANQADHYYELGFDAVLGKFHPLSKTGEIQLRLYDSKWSLLDQSNDYSYLENNELWINDRITVYYQGQLIFGFEPENIGVTSSDNDESTSSKESLEIVFYPNPTEGMLHYKANFIEGNEATLSVINDKGKVMIEKQISSNEGSVNLYSIKSGIYVIQVFDGIHLIREKVIKK